MNGSRLNREWRIIKIIQHCGLQTGSTYTLACTQDGNEISTVVLGAICPREQVRQMFDKTGSGTSDWWPHTSNTFISTSRQDSSEMTAATTPMFSESSYSVTVFKLLHDQTGTHYTHQQSRTSIAFR